jgi:hypothetical protein
VARSIIPSDGLTLAICTSELSDLHTTLKQIGGYGEDWMVGLLLVQLLEDALVKPVAFLEERLVAAGHLRIF